MYAKNVYEYPNKYIQEYPNKCGNLSIFSIFSVINAVVWNKKT